MERSWVTYISQSTKWLIFPKPFYYQMEEYNFSTASLLRLIRFQCQSLCWKREGLERIRRILPSWMRVKVQEERNSEKWKDNGEKLAVSFIRKETTLAGTKTSASIYRDDWALVNWLWHLSFVLFYLFKTGQRDVFKMSLALLSFKHIPVVPFW